MRLRVNRGAFLVGVIAIVVLVLALFVVPAIMAQNGISGIENVGVDLLSDDPVDRQTCWMIDPRDDTLTLADPSPRIVDSRIEEYPELNALMRCEAQIADYTGPASVISIDDFTEPTVGCVVFLSPLDPDPTYEYMPKTTYKWQQTTSSDGRVALSCRFKK